MNLNVFKPYPQYFNELKPHHMNWHELNGAYIYKIKLLFTENFFKLNIYTSMTIIYLLIFLFLMFLFFYIFITKYLTKLVGMGEGDGTKVRNRSRSREGD